MKTKYLTSSIALAVAMMAANAHAVDFTGYFRSGVGVSQDGKQQTANKDLLGRLGNEDDTYGEIGLGQELFKKDGVSFYVDSMVSMESDGSKDGESTKDDDAKFGLRQFNAKVKGLIASDPDAILWVGKRYYQRHDLHIIDTKYWNVSGAGAGLENLKAGPGAFSFAWIRSDGNDIDNSITNNDLNINFLDVRYAGLKPWSGAWTEFGVDYAMPNPTDEQKSAGSSYDPKNGVMVTGEISQYFDGSGINEKLVLQYANKGLAQNMISQGGGWYDVWHTTDDATGYRVILTGDIPVGERFSINHVFTYGKGEKLQAWHDNTELFSAVARGSYAWTDITKTLVELGTFERTKTWTSGSEDKESGQKYTLAQAWSAGPSMMARPEIRVYASYLTDGEGDSFNGNTDDHAWNFGVQAEAWW
ncbi:maltoporin [Aeromonas veronii]|uniref:maltoporin n=1 Tax=Aeromonas veronii TaxID=654 RepID=UPI0020919230|nr:maltoporin [Aeromonas veronii]MCO5345018.1 maltoporin [Aeromonas veronii]